MTAEEYWEGDPYLARSFMKAHKLKIEMRNQELWLQGLYNFKAVETALANAFSKRQHKYIEKPINMFETPEEQSDAAAEKERAKAIDAFKAMRKKWEIEHGSTGT